ncbi:MAG: divalent-cation tolerance protein CutA [Elusimicrobiales bacterium]
MTAQYQILMVSVPDKQVANTLAENLVGKRLAACVNIIGGVRSVYKWDGEIKKASELILLVKTRVSLMPETMLCIKESHPYSVPEIISLRIDDGNPEYLDWLGANCMFTAAPDQTKRVLPRPTIPPKGFEK